ncbi:MAG: hypothetical protein WCA15_16985, partial [Candidatus Acidiferrales bacterium]
FAESPVRPFGPAWIDDPLAPLIRDLHPGSDMKLDIVAGSVGKKQHGRDHGGRGDSYEEEGGSAGTRVVLGPLVTQGSGFFG